MQNKDRIKNLLGSGLSPELVASAVGCEPSFISQLMSDNDFAFEVAKIRAEDLESLQGRDKKYDSIEDLLLERLENVLPLMMKPRDILSALQVINSAKRRAADIINPLGAGTKVVIQNVVQLQLPEKVVQTFERNINNEVVSVEGKSLVAMPTSELLKEMRAEEKEEKEKGKENARNDQTKQIEDRSVVEGEVVNNFSELSEERDRIILDQKQSDRSILSPDSV